MKRRTKRERQLDWGVAHFRWKAEQQAPMFGPRSVSRPDCAACHIDSTGACDDHLWF